MNKQVKRKNVIKIVKTAIKKNQISHKLLEKLDFFYPILL
jgi:hypothetical protein